MQRASRQASADHLPSLLVGVPSSAEGGNRGATQGATDGAAEGGGVGLAPGQPATKQRGRLSDSNGAWSPTLLQQQLENLLAEGPRDPSPSSKDRRAAADAATGEATASPEEEPAVSGGFARGSRGLSRDLREISTSEISEISETYEKRHKLLLSRNLITNQALDQLSEEKEALHGALLERTEQLRGSEEALRTARTRVAQLEEAVRALHAQAESSLAKLAL